MAMLLPEGKQSFTNSAGAPLVGGKLYTYAAGTNTPKATYADANETAANANPVILDARGEATIFWNGNYKVVLKDANDVTIWTVDNVATQSSSSGSGSQTFTVITGDGATDNALAIQAANIIGRPIFFFGVSLVNSPTTVTVPIVDTMSQIFASTAQITIDNDLPVRPEWWGTTNGTLLKAIAALPATGGEVKLEPRDYNIVGQWHTAVGGPYVGNEKSNVKLRGAGMPVKSADGSRFISGSGTVIQGTVLNYANGFEAYNLGVDVGTYVTSNFDFGGWTPEGFVPGTHKFQGTPGNLATYIQNVAFGNIKVLAVSSLNHACLIEFINGVEHGYVECDGGFHGYVVKSTQVRGGHVWAYNQTSDAYIIKSDQYTNCQHVQIDSITVGRRDSAIETGYGYIQSTAGGYITCYIQIGKLFGVNCKTPFMRVGDDEFITDVEIGLVSCDDITGNGIDITGKFRRVQIGKHLINNTTGYGLVVNDTSGSQESIDIGSGAVTNPGAGINGYYLASAGVKHGDITMSGGTVPTVNRGSTATNLDINRIGNSGSSGLATTLKEVLNSTNLLNSWINNSGTTWPFQVVQIGNKYMVRGTVKNGTTGVVAQLPAGYRPGFTLSFITVAITAGGVRAWAHVDIDSTGNITVANFAGAAPGLGGTNCVVAFNFEYIL